MIPIDNSVAGRVADIHHLLPRSNLYIIGEHFLPVHHQLMIAPGADMSKRSSRCTATSMRWASAAR
jgi:prephenate dehydratase